jgi:hypothetical protein
VPRFAVERVGVAVVVTRTGFAYLDLAGSRCFIAELPIRFFEH